MVGPNRSGASEEGAGGSPVWGRSRWRIWGYPLTVLGVASLSLILLTVFLDYYVVRRHAGVGLLNLLVPESPSDAQQMVNGLAEVVVALLAMVITVASIVVQLAATRYTPRITEMYISDRTNLVFLSFFVVVSVFSLWITFSIRSGETYYVPSVGVTVLFLAIMVSILAMTPYFAYVFYFLDPQNVVARIRQQTVERALDGLSRENVARRQVVLLDGVEQLADVALNTIENKDKIIATRSVDALYELLDDYMHRKADLPEDWFAIRGRVAQDPDFVAVSAERLRELEEERIWVEYKIFRQFQMIYAEALNRMRDLNYVIAIDTKRLGTTALELDDRESLNLVVKFFNTFVRATLNARDVRTAYNIFNQYRQLAEEALRRGLDKLVEEVGEYFKYYAQVAFAMKLSFVTETVAYDLCALCELAYELGSACLEPLVATLLEVDKEPEAEVQETSLRGVRKAQTKLATFFLAKGEERLARRIWEDMKDEKPERLRSIYQELMSIESKDFWEIIDRGENFDFLEPERKAQLPTFFSWFPHLLDGRPAGQG